MYTLHIKKDDSSFDLYIDTEMISSGSLLADMKPPLVPPQEIDDPEDEQPEDWVTEVKGLFTCELSIEENGYCDSWFRCSLQLCTGTFFSRYFRFLFLTEAFGGSAAHMYETRLALWWFRVLSRFFR